LPSCVALALLLIAPQVGAQTNAQAPAKVIVDVPFDFMIGRVMFPAGRYTIKRLTNRNVYLQASRGRASVRIATTPIHTSSPAGTTRLIFHKENRHYQLRELWMNSAIGAMIPEPQVEQLRTIRESRVEVPAICIELQLNPVSPCLLAASSDTIP
jgi:hypothetical protein